jgi:hypothetical protein
VGIPISIRRIVGKPPHHIASQSRCIGSFGGSSRSGWIAADFTGRSSDTPTGQSNDARTGEGDRHSFVSGAAFLSGPRRDGSFPHAPQEGSLARERGLVLHRGRQAYRTIRHPSTLYQAPLGFRYRHSYRRPSIANTCGSGGRETPVACGPHFYDSNWR